MFDCTAYFIRLSYTTRHIDRVTRYVQLLIQKPFAKVILVSCAV